MRTVLLWGVLALLSQQAAVSSHILRKPSSTSDLAQLKSLLERFEETLTEAAQEEISEADYEGTNPESEYSLANQGWNLDQKGDKEPLISERTQLPLDGHSRSAIQRSRLQDILMTARKRASGCFGARMDRIGNSSGLGCNSGRG